jgi:hypothetical protein
MQVDADKVHTDRGSFKTSVLKEQPLKKAVLQAVGRKTARASAKPTGVCKKLDPPEKSCCLFGRTPVYGTMRLCRVQIL